MNKELRRELERERVRKSSVEMGEPTSPPPSFTTLGEGLGSAAGSEFDGSGPHSQHNIGAKKR